MLSGAIVTARYRSPRCRALNATCLLGTKNDGRIDILLPIEMREAPSSPLRRSHRHRALLPWIVSTWCCGVTLALARGWRVWWRVRLLHQIGFLLRLELAGRRESHRMPAGTDAHHSHRELPHTTPAGCWLPSTDVACQCRHRAAQPRASGGDSRTRLAHSGAMTTSSSMQTLANAAGLSSGCLVGSARIRETRRLLRLRAVAVCGDPVGYAAALTELEVRRSGEMSLAAAATGGSLLNRVPNSSRRDH